MSDWKVFNAPAKYNKKVTAKKCPKCGTIHSQKRGTPCPFCGHIAKSYVAIKEK